MPAYTISRIESSSSCESCGINSKDVFQLQIAGERTRNLCSLCLTSEHPEKMKLETQVGLFLKRKTNRTIYSILARAIAHAAKSDNPEYREKAEKMMKALLSTTQVVLAETGSDDGYDLLHLIKKHHQLLPMNFDDEFLRTIADSDDEMPDVDTWEKIYKAKRG
ncbi:TPA: hypothetical protein ACOXWE_004611 [Salmonella enterica]